MTSTTLTALAKRNRGRSPPALRDAKEITAFKLHLAGRLPKEIGPIIGYQDHGAIREAIRRGRTIFET